MPYSWFYNKELTLILQAFCVFLISSLALYLLTLKKPAAGFGAVLWRGLCGKELRTPLTNSQWEAKSCQWPTESPWQPILHQASLDIRLQLLLTLWVETAEILRLSQAWICDFQKLWDDKCCALKPLTLATLGETPWYGLALVHCPDCSHCLHVQPLHLLSFFFQMLPSPEKQLKMTTVTPSNPNLCYLNILFLFSVAFITFQHTLLFT